MPSDSTSTRVRRDILRARVYAAEDQWTAMLDRGGQVDFFGSALVVAPQRRFADIPAMQRYVDRVLDLDTVRARFPDLPGVRLRERRGQRRAHYACPDPVIAIPTGELWAGRESVLLHELAHHVRCCGFADASWAGHSKGFVATMVWLVEAAMGPEQALLLTASLSASGVVPRAADAASSERECRNDSGGPSRGC